MLVFNRLSKYIVCSYTYHDYQYYFKINNKSYYTEIKSLMEAFEYSEKSPQCKTLYRCYDHLAYSFELVRQIKEQTTFRMTISVNYIESGNLYYVSIISNKKRYVYEILDNNIYFKMSAFYEYCKNRCKKYYY